MHGAGGGGPKGKRNGRYKDGRYTCEAIERRRDLNAWMRMLAHTAQEIG